MSTDPPKDIAYLKSTELFHGLSVAELALVFQSASRRSYQSGEFLYMEEDPAELMYILLEGKIKLSRVTPDGQQVVLRYSTPGEAFGVITVLSEANYPVSAQAVENSQALAWNYENTRRLMLKIPQIALNAIKVMAGHVIEFQDRVRELSTERVERRIARALLRLARQTGRKIPAGVLIDLSLSRQDLAEMTGTTLFTVSRTLSQWEAKGLIKSKREQIIVCFPHGLVSIAEDLPTGKLTDQDTF
jgi:CRP-like cAMP-binding protein